MEKLNVVQQSQLVPVMSIGKKLKSIGFSGINHIARNLRAAGYTLHRMRGESGHLVYAITKEDAEQYLATFSQATTEESPSIPEIVGRVEDQVRQQREKEGWLSFRLAAPGMPDLINLKPRADGGFDLLFEEVKGVGDHLRKEQHSTLEAMKSKGIPSTITWL